MQGSTKRSALSCPCFPSISGRLLGICPCRKLKNCNDWNYRVEIAISTRQFPSVKYLGNSSTKKIKTSQTGYLDIVGTEPRQRPQLRHNENFLSGLISLQQQPRSTCQAFVQVRALEPEPFLSTHAKSITLSLVYLSGPAMNRRQIIQSPRRLGIPLSNFPVKRTCHKYVVLCV